MANLINDEASDPYVKCKKCKYCNIDTGRDGSICYECYLGQEYYAGLAKDDREWKKLLSDPSISLIALIKKEYQRLLTLVMTDICLDL